MKEGSPKCRNAKYRHVAPEVSHHLLGNECTLFTKLLSPGSDQQNYLYMKSSLIYELQKRNLRSLTIPGGTRNKEMLEYYPWLLPFV